MSYPSKLCIVLCYAKAKYCLMQLFCQAPLPTPASQAKSIWIEKGNFWSSRNDLLYVQCHVQAKKSLEVMTVSVHVNKSDQGQCFRPEDEQHHAIPSPMVHLSLARSRVSSSLQPVGPGAWAAPCPTPRWGSVWLRVSGHRLDLCQAMCQQATSLLVHRCSSP